MTQCFALAATGFEAARHVDILPEAHPAGRMHGHSFIARLRVGQSDLQHDQHFVEQFSSCIARLNYRLLNDIIAVPTDENVSRWVHKNVAVPGIQVCGIQSTRNQGADLAENGSVHVWRRFRFEAAHQLPRVPEGHQCGRMHGHGFEVILHADQDIQGRAMGVDFDFFEEIWRPLHDQLHLHCLNDVPGLENPTSEMLAQWIWGNLKSTLPQLSWVTVYETATAGCHYDGTNFRIWKERAFESAVMVHSAPTGDAKRNLHGHSYLLRLHLSAPLDEVMGWTVDYGDVKELFQPTYKLLDHHRLDQISGVADGSILSISRWIQGRVENEIPGIDRLDLFETPGNGICLNWGSLGPALPVF